jgi:hypothetical protein
MRSLTASPRSSARSFAFTRFSFVCLLLCGIVFSMQTPARASTSCPNKTPILPGQTLNGALAAGDCTLPLDGSFYDEYTFNGVAGQQIAVSMSSANFDTYLYLLQPGETTTSNASIQNDDGGGGTNSRIPAGSGFITLPATGTYSILANSFSTGETGSYALTLSAPAQPGQLIISEFRLQGATSDDEFVELYNNTDAPIDIFNYQLTVNETLPRSTSFALGATGPSVIPPRGHYLLTQLNGYTLDSYTPGDARYSFPFDFAPDAGITLTTQANVLLDKVGFTTSPAGSCEGTCLTPTSATGQYSFVRRMESGTPRDLNNNATDFMLVSTDPSTIGGNLGAPAPQNTQSHIQKSPESEIQSRLIDPSVTSASSPNRTRDASSYTDTQTPSSPTGTTGVFPLSVPNSAYTLGTLSVQRRFVNNTNQAVTKLRFRVVDVTTAPSVAGAIADVRLLTSNGVTRAPAPLPLGVALRGLTLEQPPVQQFGGGYNSSVTVDLSTTPNGKLQPGEFVDVQFLLGVAKGGSFRFFVVVEVVQQ